ncbi:hypothetical protein [Yoonia sp. SS1-5]|uniref:Uncharacterized protein n=1 Tax=Yoonia rhodophyticola TaxID=3137370 RepID=A0AAN0NLJ6_9RHOB
MTEATQIIGNSRTACLLLLLQTWRRYLSDRGMNKDFGLNTGPRFRPMSLFLSMELVKRGHEAAMWVAHFRNFQTNLGPELYQSKMFDNDMEFLIEWGHVEKPGYNDSNFSLTNKGKHHLDRVLQGDVPLSFDGFPNPSSSSTVQRASQNVVANMASLSFAEMRFQLFDASFDLYREHKTKRRNAFITFDNAYKTFDPSLHLGAKALADEEY